MSRIIRLYPSLQQMTTDPADVSYLLSLANDMRKAKNDEFLSDLPVSAPMDVNSCIIANAFNYGCEVSPSNVSGKAWIEFETKNDLQTYLKVVGVSQEEYNKWLSDNLYSEYQCRAPLTPELNKIAIDFDEGRRFVEYVVDEFDEKDSWLEQLDIGYED